MDAQTNKCEMKETTVIKKGEKYVLNIDSYNNWHGESAAAEGHIVIDKVYWTSDLGEAQMFTDKALEAKDVQIILGRSGVKKVRYALTALFSCDATYEKPEAFEVNKRMAITTKKFNCREQVTLEHAVFYRVRDYERSIQEMKERIAEYEKDIVQIKAAKLVQS